MSDYKQTKASHRDRAREGTRGEPACLLSSQTARGLQRLGEGNISDHVDEESTLDAKQSENEKTSDLFWNVGMVFNKWMLFIVIVFVINVFPRGMAEASPHPKDKTNTRKDRATFQECTPPNNRWDEAHGSPNTCDTASKGITDEEGGLTVDSVTVLTLSKQMEDMNKMIVQLRGRVDELQDRSGREKETLARQDAEAHKDIAENHSKKLEKLTREVERLTSTSTETAKTISTLSDRVKRLEVLKTDIENMEIQKVRQDAKDAHHVAAGCVEKLETVIKDVGNINTNITSVNNTVSKLSDQTTVLHTGLAELDDWKNTIVDKELSMLTQNVSAIHSVSTEAKESSNSNAENLEKLSHDLDKAKTEFTAKIQDLLSLGTVLNTSHNMNGTISELMAWRTEVSDKELPMIRQNITNNHQLGEEAKRDAGANSRLLKDHILWANATYVEFKKHQNETLKKDEEFNDKHNSMAERVSLEERRGSLTADKVEKLEVNLSAVQIFADTVQKCAFSNVGKLETLTQAVGNITTNITAINITAEQLSSRVDVIDGRVDGLDTWRTEIVDTELPTLKRDIQDASQVAKQATRRSSVNGDLLTGHIVWANWTYLEFQKHRNETVKKEQEFAKKHDHTERKLDGEELDGVMTKAVVDELKGKSSVHDIALYLSVLNMIAVAILVKYVMKAPSSAPALAPATASRNDVQQRGSRRAELYELQWSRPMEDSVCVVAFHRETEGRHADQTRSVFESVKQPCPTIHSRVIRRHEDITQLPGSRVFLVFVDFNQRNVILEDPTKGLGDLRVTTVRSLWRFGADVTVIYCGDQGSVNLDRGLFNQDLGSIHRQQELTQLKNDDRILSIYRDFSNTQGQHCRNFINRLLQRT
ncbi:myosin-3-like [Haliotis cracherodii]|uniref:myosin-3-like n=1 Tax=Haliotis cracherodii TaxID=6455 RepID=UPI0039E89659